MPAFLMPRIKPVNLGILVKESGEVGKIVGVNTYPIGDLKGSNLDKVLNFLLNEISPNYNKIYFEDFKEFDQVYLDYILEATNLIMPSGKEIRIFNIPFIIKQVNEGLNKSINTSDTMIISQDKDIHFKIILQLMDKVSFFTCIGLDPSVCEEVYNEIFKSTGVSIFQPTNIEKVIKNYSIIINFSEEIEFDLEKIRNQALIIDFSKNKPFKVLENSKKNVILIEDIRLKIHKFNDWIDEFVSPELFEALGETHSVFSQIYAKNHFYRVGDFINKGIKKAGKI
ncbi:hypothetical protein E9840_01960 [Tissierella creatinini]|nr:hypothetical protein E9840_01960 [Tissierella creatinini]